VSCNKDKGMGVRFMIDPIGVEKVIGLTIALLVFNMSWYSLTTLCHAKGVVSKGRNFH
jgi:hypothetical protein